MICVGEAAKIAMFGLLLRVASSGSPRTRNSPGLLADSSGDTNSPGLPAVTLRASDHEGYQVTPRSDGEQS